MIAVPGRLAVLADGPAAGHAHLGATVMFVLAAAAVAVSTRPGLSLWGRVGVWVWAGLCAATATALAVGT